MIVYNGHTPWCAGGHQCGLGEHRAEPITVALPRSGIGLITRVRDTRGRQFAEVRLRVLLPSDESKARLRLATLLTSLPTLIGGRRDGEPRR